MHGTPLDQPIPALFERRTTVSSRCISSAALALSSPSSFRSRFAPPAAAGPEGGRGPEPLRDGGEAGVEAAVVVVEVEEEE